VRRGALRGAEAAVEKERPNMELLWVALVVAVWILLQAWILPKLGVPT